jgi:hypothetical protein
MSASKPWERVAWETGAAWDRFLTYLHQPPPRSLIAVAEAHDAKVSAIRRMAQKNEWAARGRAYDEEQQRQAAAALTKEPDRWDRWTRMLDGAIAVALTAAVKGQAPKTAAEGSRMAIELLRFRRLLEGQAEVRTETIISEISRADPQRLTEGEREELRALYDDPRVARAFELDDKMRGIIGGEA